MFINAVFSEMGLNMNCHTSSRHGTGDPCNSCDGVFGYVQCPLMSYLRCTCLFDKEPAVIVEPVPSGATLPSAPMDISDDRADAFSRAMVPVEDIDANDHENPQLVSEYVNDIYEYMRQMEVCVP